MSDFSTFVRRPWINLDQVDANGVRAEVQVVSGIAMITDVKESERAAQFAFKADNNKYEIRGNTPKASKVYEVAKKAYEEGVPLEFRIEKVRKKGVDRTIPFDELFAKGDMSGARENIFKNLVAVRPVSMDGEPQEEWVLSSAIKTRFEEDPVDAVNGSAYDVSMEEFTGGQSNQTVKRSAPKSKEFESSQFYDRNPDGEINPGSSTVATLINLLTFVQEYNRDHEGFLSEEECRSIAVTLLAVTNELQKKIYDGKLDRPHLNFASHTRARAIMFELIRQSYPITPSVARDQDKKKEWGKALIADGLDVWRWSISHVERFLDD